MTVLTLNLDPVVHLSDEQFFQLCVANPDLQLERTTAGEIIVMPPTGGETGDRNSELDYQLRGWNKQTTQGKTFNAATGFRLPSGATRSPDAAWLQLPRWDSLTLEQQQKFPPLCPDFVVELRSPSDSLQILQAKMQEYLDNGARLGWLIDPENRRVEIYRPNQAVEVVQAPTTLSGEDVLLGFVLDLSEIL